MKNLLFILITSATILSCSNPADHNSNSADTATVINKPIISPENSKINIQVKSNLKDTLSVIDSNTLIDATKTVMNTTFPFGCSDLTKLKYPKHWKGDEEGLEEPEGKEFEEIGECFQKINSVKSIGSLKINKLEIFKIGNNYKDYNFDTLAAKSTDNCMYHLPKIGMYECYYSYAGTQKTGGYGYYGQLILVDPTTQNAKLLNIYHEYGGDQNIKHRYFILNKNSVNIYEGACYDDGCGLSQTYTIKINQAGEIDITEKTK